VAANRQFNAKTRPAKTSAPKYCLIKVSLRIFRFYPARHNAPPFHQGEIPYPTHAQSPIFCSTRITVRPPSFIEVFKNTSPICLTMLGLNTLHWVLQKSNTLGSKNQARPIASCLLLSIPGKTPKKKKNFRPHHANDDAVSFKYGEEFQKIFFWNLFRNCLSYA